MSLRYINSNGEEAFIAGRGGGGNADIIPLKQFEFDELYSKGELEDGKYYAITDDVDEATILTELAALKADIGNVDARISADGETLPLGTGTVYSAINSVNTKVTEIDNNIKNISQAQTFSTITNVYGYGFILTTHQCKKATDDLVGKNIRFFTHSGWTDYITIKSCVSIGYDYLINFDDVPSSVTDGVTYLCDMVI